jgi:pimeloyl-ACP methyl ester carboxylesterase
MKMREHGAQASLKLRMAKTLACVFASATLVACTSLPTAGAYRGASGDVSYSLLGNGRPAVILQSGLGDDRSPWATVATKLAQTHAVFAYDRPGYGESAAGVEARDACTVASELHAMLGSLGLKPPYLLVGHSLGGLYQYAFARLYPADVAGLVLLDPTHPHHWQRMQADSPAMASLVRSMRATVFTSAMRREFDDQEKCIDRLQSLPPLNRPARVLVRTQFDLIERGGFEKMVHSLESDWLSLVGATEIERVEDSGHYIQKDQPARVAAAIEAVAAQAAGGAKR